MEKTLFRSRVLPLQIPEACEDQVKEALEFRFLKYPEDLKDCVILEGIDRGSWSIQWKFESSFNKGEMIGHFNLDNTRFIKNEHWSERMRIANGNPRPVCSQCGKYIRTGGGLIGKTNTASNSCTDCG